MEQIINYIKNFFIYDSVIGLCEIKKETEYTYFNIPEKIKKTHYTNVKNNTYLYI